MGHVGDQPRRIAAVPQHPSSAKKLGGSVQSQASPDWCRWAKKETGSSNASTSEALQLPAASAPASWDQQGSPAAPEEQWSLQTRQALAVVDEAVLNFDLIEALVCHIVEVEAAHGPGAMLEVNAILCLALVCHLVEAEAACSRVAMPEVWVYVWYGSICPFCGCQGRLLAWGPAGGGQSQMVCLLGRWCAMLRWTP